MLVANGFILNGIRHCMNLYTNLCPKPSLPPWEQGIWWQGQSRFTRHQPESYFFVTHYNSKFVQGNLKISAYDLTKQKELRGKPVSQRGSHSVISRQTTSVSPFRKEALLSVPTSIKVVQTYFHCKKPYLPQENCTKIPQNNIIKTMIFFLNFPRSLFLKERMDIISFVILDTSSPNTADT